MNKAAKELIEKLAGVSSQRSSTHRFRGGGYTGKRWFATKHHAEADRARTRNEANNDALKAVGVVGGTLAAGTAAAGYGAHKAYKHLTKKDEPVNDEKKEAQLALIQKIAGSPGRLRTDMAHTAYREMGVPIHGKPRQSVLDAHSKQFNVPAAPPAFFGRDRPAEKKTPAGPGAQKESSMRGIIDDIIKGAKDNSFGRPVSIQVDSDFTPLDLAKTAGALQALSEQGYSVKQAAAYLGLTEKQVQDIVATVR